VSLQAYLYEYLNNCDSVRALVDETNGIRRMDRPSKGTFRTCICIGNVIWGVVPGVERRPFLNMSPAFSIWVRPELEAMGDLTVHEIFIELMKRLAWVGDHGFPAQDCVGSEPPILVYASEFASHDIPPYYDEDHQAFTTRFRIRFVVGLATCLPVADDCSPCTPIPAGDVEGVGIGSGLGGVGGLGEPGSETLPPQALFAGEAFAQVSPGQEASVLQRDLYVVHPSINTTIFNANKKPESIGIAYTTTSLIGQFSSAWFAGIRAITTEHDYWHIGGASQANRIEHTAGIVWHVRPSLSLADRMADYVITNLNPALAGAFCDEANGELPQHYLTAYRTADEWVESNLAIVRATWTAMHLQYVSRLKQAFGSNRAVVPNSAGTPYESADGIWMEEAHVVANGVPWALARFQEQRDHWEANDNRFVHPNDEIASVLNVKGGSTLDPVFSIPGLVWPGDS